MDRYLCSDIDKVGDSDRVWHASRTYEIPQEGGFVMYPQYRSVAQNDATQPSTVPATVSASQDGTCKDVTNEIGDVPCVYLAQQTIGAKKLDGVTWTLPQVCEDEAYKTVCQRSCCDARQSPNAPMDVWHPANCEAHYNRVSDYGQDACHEELMRENCAGTCARRKPPVPSSPPPASYKKYECRSVIKYATCILPTDRSCGYGTYDGDQTCWDVTTTPEIEVERTNCGNCPPKPEPIWTCQVPCPAP